MRKLLGIGAVIMGTVGVLVCVAVIGLGWRAAVQTADQVTRTAARADEGLTEADARLSRVEQRLVAIRANLDRAGEEAERLTSENPELPRVRSAIEQLIDRLIPTIDQVAALADSLRTVAAGLRAAADIVDQLRGSAQAPGRARIAADTIDQAAATLNIPREKIEEVKSAQAVRATRELITLVREAVAGSERLAQGLAESRQAIAAGREWTAETRDQVVLWVYLAAAGNTVVVLWIALGQLCLVGWGRRRIANRGARSPDKQPN